MIEMWRQALDEHKVAGAVLTDKGPTWDTGDVVGIGLDRDSGQLVLATSSSLPELLCAGCKGGGWQYWTFWAGEARRGGVV